MHQIELEQLEHEAKIIEENEITADQFSFYDDFFHASNYGVEKCSAMWMDKVMPINSKIHN
jgi:hypothetical protein